jgi:hypothetical protein
MFETSKKNRYILTFSASDFSGSLWINAFNDMGKVLLERDAAEIAELKERVCYFFSLSLFLSPFPKKNQLMCHKQTPLYINQTEELIRCIVCIVPLRILYII